MQQHTAFCAATVLTRRVTLLVFVANLLLLLHTKILPPPLLVFVLF